MHKVVKNLYKKEKAQAMIEYGLIVSFISVALIAAVFLLGGKDGGGICEKNDNASAISFIDYTYNKQGDTGLYSLYRSVTCRLGGWSEKVVFKDKYNSFEEAEALGFEFLEKNSWGTSISGYTGSLKNIKLPSHIWVSYDDGKTRNLKAVDQIKPSAFLNKGLTSVILLNTLNSILGSTFEKNKLKSIDIPENVTRIHSSAFKNNELSQVKFSESVNLRIDKEAFANNQLKSITIPTNVTYIEEHAFKGNDLQEIIIKDRVEPLKFKVDGKSPSAGWTSGKYKLESGKWIKSN